MEEQLAQDIEHFHVSCAFDKGQDKAIAVAIAEVAAVLSAVRMVISVKRVG